MERAELGQELRDMRVARGLTQLQVAERCGMSQSHVAAYEAGRRPISVAQQQRLRAALQPRPSELLRENAAEVREIASRHGATQVRVFGSIARGEDRYDSDVDLLVTLGPGVGLFDLAEMRLGIQAALGVPVDLVSEGALKAKDADILAEAVAV